MTKKDTLKQAFKGLTTVIHTASPPHGKLYSLYYKGTPALLVTPHCREPSYSPAPTSTVNVEGTQNVVDACVEMGVQQLIFTSSASVVFNGQHIKGTLRLFP